MHFMLDTLLSVLYISGMYQVSTIIRSNLQMRKL